MLEACTIEYIALYDIMGVLLNKDVKIL